MNNIPNPPGGQPPPPNPNGKQSKKTKLQEYLDKHPKLREYIDKRHMSKRESVVLILVLAVVVAVLLLAFLNQFFFGNLLLLTAFYFGMALGAARVLVGLFPEMGREKPPKNENGEKEIAGFNPQKAQDIEGKLHDGWRAAFHVVAGTNNRRWAFLVGAFVVTLLIAPSRPGPALLPEAVRSVRDDVIGTNMVRRAESAWEFFRYGDKVPMKAAPQPAKPQGFFAKIFPPSWFWFQATIAYLLLVIVYFFFAYSDEVIRAIKAMWAVVTAKREAAAHAGAAQQGHGKKDKKGGESPTPTPPTKSSSFGGFWKVLLLGLGIDEIIEVVGAGIWAWRRKS